MNPNRFWSKVSKTNSCWLWIACLDRDGYGQFRVGKKVRQAHIVAYELVTGVVPPELQLDHLCRNRACVRPDHLEAVTKLVNDLRGMSPMAVNARKTCCPQGHPYAGKNLLVTGGIRKCRICSESTQRRYRERFKVISRQPRPSREVLAEDLKMLTWTELGRKYGVTDNAVRKWARKYGFGV